MSFSLKVEHNENTDEYYILLPDDLLKKMNWKTGDNISWKKNKDGSFSLKKVK